MASQAANPGAPSSTAPSAQTSSQPPRTQAKKSSKPPTPRPPANAIYSFWIVGRNGGLLYTKDIQPSAAPIDFNDKLRLASSWFGMCGISAQLAPEQSRGSPLGGVHVLRADTFDLYSYQTMTGTTFMLVTSPGHTEALSLLQDQIYRLYCDYVLKNPFHEAEQVIKSDLFDAKLVELLSSSIQR